MQARPASVRIRSLVGVAAGLLALGGFVGLGLRGDDAVEPPAALNSASPSDESSTTRFSATTDSWVRGRRLTRAPVAPARSAQPTVPATEPTSTLPPTAPPTPSPPPEACATEQLTVIAPEGCPVVGIVVAVIDVTDASSSPPERVAQTEEAAALPQQSDRF